MLRVPFVKVMRASHRPLLNATPWSSQRKFLSTDHPFTCESFITITWVNLVGYSKFLWPCHRIFEYCNINNASMNKRNRRVTLNLIQKIDKKIRQVRLDFRQIELFNPEFVYRIESNCLFKIVPDFCMMQFVFQVHRASNKLSAQENKEEFIRTKNGRKSEPAFHRMPKIRWTNGYWR
jgi:hypothetical protein